MTTNHVQLSVPRSRMSPPERNVELPLNTTAGCPLRASLLTVGIAAAFDCTISYWFGLRSYQRETHPSVSSTLSARSQSWRLSAGNGNDWANATMCIVINVNINIIRLPISFFFKTNCQLSNFICLRARNFYVMS